MKKVFTIFISFIIFLSLAAQETPVLVAGGEKNSATGTYQFIFRDRISAESVVLTDFQLAKLEILRDDIKTVYIRFSEATTILLPSKQEINNPLFVPITNYIYIVEQSNYEDYNNLPTIPFQ